MTIQEAINSCSDGKVFRRKWVEEVKNDNSEIDDDDWAIEETDGYITPFDPDVELFALTIEDVLATDWETKP